MRGYADMEGVGSEVFAFSPFKRAFGLGPPFISQQNLHRTPSPQENSLIRASVQVLWTLFPYTPYMYVGHNLIQLRTQNEQFINHMNTFEPLVHWTLNCLSK